MYFNAGHGQSAKAETHLGKAALLVGEGCEHALGAAGGAQLAGRRSSTALQSCDAAVIARLDDLRA